MATEGFVKFEYFSKGVPPYYDNRTFPELLDDEKITIETPCLEMSYHQYFGLFKKFLMSVGFNEKNIMQGACSLAFNEMNDEKTMREVAEEYELIMSEDLPDIIADSKKQDEKWIEKHSDTWEQRYWALYRKMYEIENEKQFSDHYPHPDQQVYSEEELNAMCDKAASDEEKNKCREYNLREAEYYDKRVKLDAEYTKAKIEANSPYNDGWTQEHYQKIVDEDSLLTKDRDSNFPGENTVCDKDDPSDECKQHWNNFWDEDTAIADKVQEGYNYWEEDTSNEDMWDQGVMKVTTNDPMNGWDGLVPGSQTARESGCICPILDNEEMPDDAKWVDVECPIHGRKK